MSANVFFQTIIFILRYHLKLSHFFSNHLYFVPIFNLQGYHQFFTRKLSIPSLVTSGFEVETWVVNFSGMAEGWIQKWRGWIPPERRFRLKIRRLHRKTNDWIPQLYGFKVSRSIFQYIHKWYTKNGSSNDHWHWLLLNLKLYCKHS